MSLYSFDFKFLPRPPRSPLSWGDEDTRAMLPNFENVSQLQEFVLRLFDYNFQINKGIDVHFKIGIGFECFILLISTLIVGRRIYEGNFWIFRLIKTNSGSILVPNTILAFIVTEAVFKLVFITCLIEFTKFRDPNSNGPLNFLLWILLPWCALIYGAFLAAVGTYYATPNGIRHGIRNKDQHSGILKKFLLHAHTANFIAFSIPIFTCISIAIPSFIANHQYTQVRSEQVKWLLKYEKAIVFTQDMILEAQMIWYESLKAMNLAARVYILWFVWAMICFLIYTTLSVKLIMAILTEMRKSKMEEMKFLVTTLHVPLQDQTYEYEEEDIVLNQFTILNADQVNRDRSKVIVLTKQEESDEIRAEIDDTHHKGRVYDIKPSIEAIGNADEQGLRNKPSEQTLQAPTTTRSSSESNKEGKRLLANKISNLIVNQKNLNEQAKQIQVSSIHEQKKELRKAAINILAQVSVISPGCVIFGGIALYLAFATYGGYEQAFLQLETNQTGTYFERLYGIGFIFIIYATLILGSFIFCCVLFRVYEPVFVKNQQVEKTSSTSGSNQIISKSSSKLNQKS